jgi:hypothetical protein
MLVPGGSGNTYPVSSVTAISIDGDLVGIVIGVGADVNVDTEAFLAMLEEDVLPYVNLNKKAFFFDNARTHCKL